MSASQSIPDTPNPYLATDQERRNACSGKHPWRHQNRPPPPHYATAVTISPHQPIPTHPKLEEGRVQESPHLGGCGGGGKNGALIGHGRAGRRR